MCLGCKYSSKLGSNLPITMALDVLVLVLEKKNSDDSVQPYLLCCFNLYIYFHVVKHGCLYLHKKEMGAYI